MPHFRELRPESLKVPGCGGLVGLHSSLYWFSGAAAGPSVCGCETERWENRQGSEDTRELDDEMYKMYPYLFE
ncbi:hypothetical protein Taro_043960 [Colocasia esculenta]|uniref:Uncharacterized protein n=1 Tax=Colocasia esculenta TaxID=4460 RepID=A0A843WSQ5_COLES|nr:hypothetical protein [Colocasia esculenta]